MGVSREQTNAAGQKMYIQTKMAEYAHLHVRPEGHGVRHGGVFLAPRGEGRRRLEGFREGNEEGPPLPCGGVLTQSAPSRQDERVCTPRDSTDPALRHVERGPLLPDYLVFLSCHGY